MKRFSNFCLILFTLTFAINVKAQIPSYALVVTNRVLSADLRSATFDILITHTDANQYEYAAAQYIFKIPQTFGDIGVGTGANSGFQFDSVGGTHVSDFPPTFIPRNPSVAAIVINGIPSFELRLAANPLPGSGSGLILPQGVPMLVIRMKLKVNTGILNWTSGFAFRDSCTDNPVSTLRTRINAYIGTINTEITRCVNHSIHIGGVNTFINVGNFSDSTKWSNGAPPLAGDTAVIAANCIVDITIPLLSSLTVNLGISLDMGSFSLPAIDTIINNGAISTQNISTEPLPSGIIYTGTIEYNANEDQTVVNSTYSKLKISGTGNKRMNGSFTLTNNLNLLGGSLVIGANTLTINGAIETTAGLLTGGVNSNLTIVGTGVAELPSVSLNNLILNRATGINLSGAMIIHGILTLTSGPLVIGTNTLTINGSISQASGTLSGGATSNLRIFGGGTAINLPSVSLNDLTLERLNGINLTGAITINGILTLSSGLLNILTNNLTLGPSATIVGTPSPSRMIVATSTGTVRKMFTGSGARTFSFPVGDFDSASEYSPINLNFTTGTYGTGSYAAVNLKNLKHPNNMSPTDYIKRYWTVTQNAITSFSCVITGQYSGADVIGNDSAMWTGSWNGSAWRLLNQANAVNNQILGTVTSFSDFTGGMRINMGGGINTFIAAGNFSDSTKWSNGTSPLIGEQAIIAANCIVDITMPVLSSITIDGGIVLNMTTFPLPGILTISNIGTITTQNISTTPMPSGITYSGTIIYNANGAQTVVNSTYTNLTIAGSGNKIMKGSFTVLDLLNLLGGSLVIDSTTLTINDSIGFSGGALTGGVTSNLTIAGNSAEISLSSISLKNLTLNRSNGLKLSGALSINGTMTLTSGDVSLNRNIITLGPAATLAETGGNTVKGDSGYIVTTRTLNNITSVNVAGLGAVITTARNMGATEIRRGHGIQTLSSGKQSIQRYYDIIPSNDSLLNATLVFNYDESELNGLPENSLALFQTETIPCLRYIPRYGTRNIVNNNISLSGISSFSRWTAADSVGPLPTGYIPMIAPIDYMLSQNYPNPFNPNTKINYGIPESGVVNISIFDMSGREIEVLIDERYQQTGYYSIQFNASNLSSGIYFYKIVVNGSSKKFIETRKMIILK